MSRRILQICPHDIAPFGQLCERYAQAAERIDADVTTVFLAPPDKQQLDFAEYLGAEDLSAATQLRKALLRYAAQPWDLVLCHRYRSYWSVVGTALAQRPCIVVAHEFRFLKKWQRRVNRLLFARRFRFAGVSPAVADELAAVVGHAEVLPNVIDVEAVQSELLPRAQARAELGLDPQRMTVGVVGRLHYRKRPAVALEAFRLFHADHPQTELVFMGDGDQQLAAFSEADNVRCTGYVPNAHKYMRAFDVLLHTCDCEAFGMVVLEAMLAGVPVVVLSSNGPPYVLGELGVYPQHDTPAAFAEALNRALAVDLSDYRPAALQRVHDNFSVEALSRVLDGLMAQA